ncbi:hypothetical protein [Salinisphaera hydrothermalis]|uniref:Lipoprotein n=1 Tax=Salinisphaera hydrothermalis (strain C41B8) TaxID=1304275 RepID=A0A084IHA7_SALHC|nr:hypothetical protein [Salinisphaera hydrothermalis]KEZ76091.1 hypothetical protein C41B8_16794 [Salinisphaera hydrothermalis C41B8]
MSAWSTGLACTLLATTMLSGCAALQYGSGHSKLAKQANVLQNTPAARHADAQQRLTDALATIYADSSNRPLRYYSKFVDLNGNGQREAVVYVKGPNGCDLGCDLYVMARDGDRYEVVSRIPTSRAPLYQLAASHDGWHDLLVTTLGEDNGSQLQRMQYAGGGYVPVDDKGAADAQRTALIPNLQGPGHAIPAKPVKEGRAD